MRQLTKYTLVFFTFSMLVGNLPAQAFEIAPYAGSFFSTTVNLPDASKAELKNDWLVGIRAGGYMSPRFVLQGNFGYINDFEFQRTDMDMRAIIWELMGSYHFIPEGFRSWQPYLSLGLGGVTGFVRDGDVLLVGPARFEDRDTWFAVSYGGGMKGVRLWGPVGVVADFRGRTLPNFLRDSITWFEFNGGLTFTFGER